MIAIVLSNDWELYGDGSGDYETLQGQPLSAMLDVLERAGAKLTVMAEIGQQWAHRELGRTEPWASAIADAWDAAMRDTVARGHDVQLHWHPQWLAAMHTAGKWHLDMDRWAVSRVEPGLRLEMLKRGKADLETLLRPICADYACVAFRAGAYCIQPSVGVIEALIAAGFLADTSVTKDGVSDGFVDFREAPSHVVPWRIGREVTQIAAGERATGRPLELPVAASRTRGSAGLRRLLPPAVYYRLAFGADVPQVEINWVKRNRAAMVAAQWARSGAAPVPPLPIVVRRWRRLLGKLVARETVQLDYDFLPAAALVAGIRRAVQASRRQQLERPLPIVLSGHTKNMQDTDNLARTVQAIRHEFGTDAVFWNLREAVAAWA
jgi:hypothetical protein